MPMLDCVHHKVQRDYRIEYNDILPLEKFHHQTVEGLDEIYRRGIQKEKRKRHRSMLILSHSSDSKKIFLR